MQKTWRRFAALGAAVVGVSAYSTSADIIGFSDFGPVNISGPSQNTISMAGSTFEVTDGQANEVVSAWNVAPQSITAFTASYTYQATGDSSWLGDGSTIAFQNPANGAMTALGAGSGGLGYTGIANNSAAIGLDLYNGEQSYRGGSELSTGGQQGQLNNLNNVDLSTGDTMMVRLSYSGTTLTQTVADLATGAAASETYTNVNLPSIVGSTTALVGITGATDGNASTQTISNFLFKTLPTSAMYTPLGLTGFTQSLIVPAGTANAAAAITATMDQGTVKSGDTFFEQGADASNPTAGLPASGSTFISQNDSNHIFQMQSYSGPDALLLGANNPTGTLTLTQPEALAGLSILLADGNGNEPFDVTVNYLNGTSETLAGAVSPDWFNNGTVAWTAGERIDVDNNSFENDGNNPNLYQVDLGLNDQTDAISSLTFNFDGASGDSSNMAIFAVSGVAVPEPSSAVLLGVAAVALARRRRARRRAV
jgi:hypothetical protein